MRCPTEVAEILAEILTAGLLRIRVEQDARRCSIEADHVHNLPAVIATSTYSHELLDYYWSVERPSFMQRSSVEDIAAFEPLWNALSAHVTLAEGDIVPARARV